ncbi:MAG: GPW/gp25 family protein [Calditrichaceae bacterium]|nr:GPW/gp25 family protein [Calditrichia bacterium]NUQ41380.1 GPW/gp25 family protein [Calditrichaceae bacterium]
MAKEFLGSGWKFPVRVDSAGKIVLSRQEEDIREAIWIILSTARGERAMRPDFGCGIHEMVFDPINAGTVNRVESTVREALVSYESRIEVVNVTVSDTEADTGKLMISIDYRVRATNHEFNLVFPFYLQEGTE